MNGGLGFLDAQEKAPGVMAPLVAPNFAAKTTGFKSVARPARTFGGEAGAEIERRPDFRPGRRARAR